VHQPTFLWEVVTAQETWDALPEDLKPLIEAAAKLTTYEGLTHFYHADREAMKEYRAGPNEIITLDDTFVSELGDAGRDWARKTAEAQRSEGKPRMAEILDDYFTYRDAWIAQGDYLVSE
jgi:TRAP-type mannitol/chloroaromatic compound transport system substrate-binding protein